VSTLPLFPDLPEGEPDDLTRARLALEGIDRVYEAAEAVDFFGDNDEWIGLMRTHVEPHLRGGLAPMWGEYLAFTKSLDMDADPEGAIQAKLTERLAALEAARLRERATVSEHG